MDTTETKVPMEILQFFGRFHPVVLHFPIGFLFLGFIMQLMAQKPKFQNLQAAVGFTLVLGLISAAITTLLGYWLSTEGGYEEKLLNQHKWLGFATTVLAGMVYLIYRSNSLKKIYLPLYGITIVALMVTGHLGGNITHGSDYLLENAPDGIRAAAGLPPKVKEESVVLANMDEAFIYKDLIRPIIDKKCVSCHNPGKVKGELLMNTVEGLQKGGKTGATIIPGDPEKSLMAVRINLPTTEKKHMPPRGKKQLDTDEKALIEWWIEQGADFSHQVLDVEVPEKIQNILDKRIPRESAVYAMDISAASAKTIAKSKAAGIQVYPIALESPLLQVSMTDQQDNIGQKVRLIKRLKENIVHLELSRSAITDDHIKTIAQFPNLVQLRLDGTGVTDVGLKQLAKLEHLEYLNLYNTQVTDDGIAFLSGLPKLKKLYLWQTEVSDQGVQKVLASLPGININLGKQADTLFNDVRLKPPLIAADQDLFTDDVEVSLKLNLQNVDIFYTLDGSEPSIESTPYEAPFQLDRSGEVRAIAIKEGWENSEVAQRQFVKVSHQAQSVKLAVPPNERYAANGGASLVDLTKGTARFTDGSWLGWENQHMSAIIDLGAVKEVKGITVSALESTGAWIFFPKGVRISSSDDGKRFTPQLENTYPTSPSANDGDLRNFQEQLEQPVQTRYLKVEVLSNLVNPDWHQGAGQPCWVFLDEIIVE